MQTIGLPHQGYLVQVEDRAFHQGHARRVAAEQTASDGAEARRMATALRTRYRGSRYSVSFEDNAAGDSMGGGRRWISLVSQELDPETRRMILRSNSGHRMMELPATDRLAIARRFFWPQVHAKSRKQRKRMTERLAQLLVGPARSSFRQQWAKMTALGRFSMLDRRHAAYRDSDYLGRENSSLLVIDEQVHLTRPHRSSSDSAV